jgi:hypothetical protein
MSLAEKYGIPSGIMQFVDSGLLQVVSEVPAEKTVEFRIAFKESEDDEGRTTAVSLTWIHPDHNAQFSDYEGDFPNFHVTIDTADLGEEFVDGLDTPKDLVGWLEGLL